MFCPKCGTQIQEGAVFCGKCGMRAMLIEEQVKPNPQPQPQPKTEQKAVKHWNEIFNENWRAFFKKPVFLAAAIVLTLFCAFMLSSDESSLSEFSNISIPKALRELDECKGTIETISGLLDLIAWVQMAHFALLITGIWLVFADSRRESIAPVRTGGYHMLTWAQVAWIVRNILAWLLLSTLLHNVLEPMVEDFGYGEEILEGVETTYQQAQLRLLGEAVYRIVCIALINQVRHCAEGEYSSVSNLPVVVAVCCFIEGASKVNTYMDYQQTETLLRVAHYAVFGVVLIMFWNHTKYMQRLYYEHRNTQSEAARMKT